MNEIILFMGKNRQVACDEKCNKAWGINCRPSVLLSDNPDDFAYLSDDELSIAPPDPGTYEGGHAKPINQCEIPNKWCVRECERLVMCEIHEEIVLKNFNERILNITPDAGQPTNPGTI